MALLAVVQHLRRPARRWLLPYAVAGVIAVGTLPTNLSAFAVLAAWALIGRRDAVRSAALWRELAWLLATPAGGLVFFLSGLGHADSILREASRSSLVTLAWQWPAAALVDSIPLVALVAVLAAVAAGRRQGSGPVVGSAAEIVPARRRDGVTWLLWLAAALLVPLACAAAVRPPPSARVFVPYLPMVYVALGLTVVSALDWAVTRGLPARVAHGALAALCLVLVAAAFLRERRMAAEEQYTGSPLGTLYDQPYHHGYRLIDALRWLRQRAEAGPCILFLGRQVDVLTFVLYHRCQGEGQDRYVNAPYYWVGAFADSPDTCAAAADGLRDDGVSPLILAGSDTEAEEAVQTMTERLGVPLGGGLVRQAEFGQFRVYELPPVAGAPSEHARPVPP